MKEATTLTRDDENHLKSRIDALKETIANQECEILNKDQEANRRELVCLKLEASQREKERELRQRDYEGLQAEVKAKHVAEEAKQNMRLELQATHFAELEVMQADVATKGLQIEKLQLEVFEKNSIIQAGDDKIRERLIVNDMESVLTHGFEKQLEMKDQELILKEIEIQEMQISIIKVEELLKERTSDLHLVQSELSIKEEKDRALSIKEEKDRALSIKEEKDRALSIKEEKDRELSIKEEKDRAQIQALEKELSKLKIEMESIQTDLDLALVHNKVDCDRKVETETSTLSHLKNKISEQASSIVLLEKEKQGVSEALRLSEDSVVKLEKMLADHRSEESRLSIELEEASIKIKTLQKVEVLAMEKEAAVSTRFSDMEKKKDEEMGKIKSLVSIENLQQKSELESEIRNLKHEMALQGEELKKLSSREESREKIRSLEEEYHHKEQEAEWKNKLATEVTLRQKAEAEATAVDLKARVREEEMEASMIKVYYDESALHQQLKDAESALAVTRVKLDTVISEKESISGKLNASISEKKSILGTSLSIADEEARLAKLESELVSRESLIQRKKREVVETEDALKAREEEFQIHLKELELEMMNADGLKKKWHEHASQAPAALDQSLGIDEGVGWKAKKARENNDKERHALSREDLIKNQNRELEAMRVKLQDQESLRKKVVTLEEALKLNEEGAKMPWYHDFDEEENVSDKQALKTAQAQLRLLKTELVASKTSKSSTCHNGATARSESQSATSKSREQMLIAKEAEIKTIADERSTLQAKLSAAQKENHRLSDERKNHGKTENELEKVMVERGVLQARLETMECSLKVAESEMEKLKAEATPRSNKGDVIGVLGSFEGQSEILMQKMEVEISELKAEVMRLEGKLGEKVDVSLDVEVIELRGIVSERDEELSLKTMELDSRELELEMMKEKIEVMEEELTLKHEGQAREIRNRKMFVQLQKIKELQLESDGKDGTGASESTKKIAKDLIANHGIVLEGADSPYKTLKETDKSEYGDSDVFIVGEEGSVPYLKEAATSLGAMVLNEMAQEDLAVIDPLKALAKEREAKNLLIREVVRVLRYAEEEVEAAFRRMKLAQIKHAVAPTLQGVDHIHTVWSPAQPDLAGALSTSDPNPNLRS